MPLLVYAIVSLVISVAITMIMTPEAQPPTPAGFDEFDFPQADEGTPQCVVFGDCWSEDWMVLAVGNYRSVPIMAEGGKK